MPLPRLDSEPIVRARRRNERIITLAALMVSVAGMAVASWRVATVESTQGWRILIFAITLGVLYATFLFRQPRPGEVWIRATIEVSCATVVMFLDMLAGPDFLVTSSTAYLYVVAVGLATLRLDLRLTAYVTVLGLVSQSAIYFYGLHDPSLHVAGPALSLARLYQELVFRLLMLAVMGGLGMVLAATLRKEIARSAEEERVRTAFGRYVDAKVVRRVLAGDLRIAPEHRVITVMFVDIRDFTRMAESRDAADVFRLLSATLDAFSQEVQKQGGIVNKYLGDGLLAIFGAPEDQPDHPRRAVRCALRIVEEARLRNEDGRFPGLRVGVGIHSGDAVVGDLGGERREFTAIGDVVNVASRVESANKELGTSILCTRDTWERLGEGAQGRMLAPITLRGRGASVEIFEVVGLDRAELSSTGIRREPPPR